MTAQHELATKFELPALPHPSFSLLKSKVISWLNLLDDSSLEPMGSDPFVTIPAEIEELFYRLIFQ